MNLSTASAMEVEPTPSEASTVATPRDAGPSQPARKFKFGEFFAGMGGYSLAVHEVCDQVEVMDPLDGYGGAWDIMDDSHFESAQKSAAELDHSHFAPPCRSLTMSRRTDEHGSVPVIRSFENPEGWTPDAAYGNKIIERMIVLAFIVLDNGGTISVENPWWSFIWYLMIMAKLLSYPNMELFELHQCAYGAETVKPTGILTNASWVKAVRLQCGMVRPHRHLQGGLVGHCWDYISEQMVWRTSLAAEYPCGLCTAWAKALKAYLRTDYWKRRALETSFMVVGRFQNTLVRMKPSMSQRTANNHQMSNSALREKENSSCTGGLRNPARAVAKSRALQQTGLRIRKVLQPLLSDEVLNKIEHNLQDGFPEAVVQTARAHLAREFGVQPLQQGYQEPLLAAMLTSAQDPDAEVLPKWLRDGFPLGIEAEVQHTGVFPKTDEVSASIEASRVCGQLLEDWDGSAQNFPSFWQAPDKAQAELDRLEQTGRASVVHSWEEVVAAVGGTPILTQLACLIKMKDGKEKVRLLVDMRRSGVNGKMVILERIVLPRIWDVAKSSSALFHGLPDHFSPEMLIADFLDAFYTMNVCQQERKYIVVKGLPDSWGRIRYYLITVVAFGLACGPLLWGRLAAAVMRLSQATVHEKEARSQCYVDDPLLIAIAATKRDRTRIFCLYLLLWCATGFDVAWHKAQRGLQVDWIGFSVAFVGPFYRDFSVTLPQDKLSKLLDTFQELSSFRKRGMIPLPLLSQAAGVLSWVSNVIPLARPWTGMLWAALTQARSVPAKATTRLRKGLVFVKQVQHAVTWLEAMVRATMSGEGTSLTKVFHFKQPASAPVLFRTDACPHGMGGMMLVCGTPVAWWSDPLTEEEPWLSFAGPGFVRVEAQLRQVAWAG